ncbi:TonB C-terminal domain-containing protein [Sulfurimonas sp.]|uniref:TonB C-terminal domain-containing protein n=1 Tax=Sulfurimonas sp. TaxID=2022749 RepID=UPI00260EBE66|nr:TonB C-terminal domain-containing protein [Sulfurimonas sp.]
MKTYALKKDNYVSVSITLPKEISHRKKTLSHSIQIQSSQEAETKNIDVNSLFSDVWTQKISHKKSPKKPINSKRIQEIQKQLHTTKENEVKSVIQSVNKINYESKEAEEESTSTANEVNEYLAKIQSIVYQYFNVPPNSQGNSVKTVIELDAFGKLVDFRVLNYSSNQALNEEVDKMKDRLQNVVFPVNPQHINTKTVVILISKE